MYCCVFQLNCGVRSLKMVTIPKHVGVKELKNTFIVKLCICWCYQVLNIKIHGMKGVKAIII